MLTAILQKRIPDDQIGDIMLLFHGSILDVRLIEGTELTEINIDLSKIVEQKLWNIRIKENSFGIKNGSELKGILSYSLSPFNSKPFIEIYYDGGNFRYFKPDIYMTYYLSVKLENETSIVDLEQFKFIVM